ncbi:hypothetical protein FCV25MIE_29455, partial [Fagus crenata]
ICHGFGAWDCHGYHGECRFSMDSYDLGVSGDTTDMVQLTMEFVDEDVEGIRPVATVHVDLTLEQLDLAAKHSNLVSLKESGSQSVEELGDKRADFEVVMVDEDFEFVIIDEVVPPSIRKFDKSESMSQDISEHMGFAVLITYPRLYKFMPYGACGHIFLCFSYLFISGAHGGTVDLVEAVDAAQPKLLENLAEKPLSGQ